MKAGNSLAWPLDLSGVTGTDRGSWGWSHWYSTPEGHLGLTTILKHTLGKRLRCRGEMQCMKLYVECRRKPVSRKPPKSFEQSCLWAARLSFCSRMLPPLDVRLFKDGCASFCYYYPCVSAQFLTTWHKVMKSLWRRPLHSNMALASSACLLHGTECHQSELMSFGLMKALSWNWWIRWNPIFQRAKLSYNDVVL